ncbi:unnamed protein product [Effrenium voratum]|nr:unnamed protein product [Effrenium voratum]
MSASMWQASYQYPGPLLVRNTFIDDPNGRLDSLEGFLHERQAFSCPVSRISEPGSGVEGALPKPTEVPEDEVTDKSNTAQASTEASGEPDEGSDCSTVDTGNRVSSTPDLPNPAVWAMPAASEVQPFYPAMGGYPFAYMPAGPAPTLPAETLPPPPEQAPSAPQVLRLQDALGQKDAEDLSAAQQVHQAAAAAAAQAVTASHEEQVLAANAFASASSLLQQKDAGASAELPSAGSSGHQAGQCRPCAFWTTKAGRFARRNHAKRAFFGALSEMQRCLSLGGDAPAV